MAGLRRNMHLEGKLFIKWGDPLEHIWMYAFTPAVPQQMSIQTNGWFELSPYLPVLFGDATEHSIREFWAKSTKDMWGIPLVLAYAETLSVLDGMRQIRPKIYFEDPVLINRFDDENWALALDTADPDVLIKYARHRGCYKDQEGVTWAT